MSRRRKHGLALPLRIEARVWKDGTTTTYRYLAPSGEKVYLGTDLGQALAAYRHVTHQHAAPVDGQLSEAIKQYRAAQGLPETSLVQFHSRAVLNASGRAPYSRRKVSVPTGFRCTETRPDVSRCQQTQSGGVADGTRTHDDQNHNLGPELSIHAGFSDGEGNTCD